MRKKMIAIAVVFCAVSAGYSATTAFYNDALDSAKSQLTRLYNAMGTTYTSYPRSIDGNGAVVRVNYSDWTSGFFAGSLWLMAQYTNDATWKTWARNWTNTLSSAATVNDHDVGFRINCSYGSGLQFSSTSQYKLDTAVMMRAARTLSGRYNATVKAIKSWDTYTKGSTTYTYPVIIDNMMNLELLCWATKASGDSSFVKIAKSHANTTLKNHFRSNFSSYHLVAYDQANGNVLGKMTVQGYADESSWARGQGWGLYGYTMMFRETKDSSYLIQATHIADYIISRLPTEMVPYWDFDVPTSPTPSRDASAAAIYASALCELSTYVKGASGATYLQKAKAILQSLSSSAYTAAPNTSGNFILKHSTGNKPAGTEIDVPINYADYYYLEALLRYKKLDESTSIKVSGIKAANTVDQLGSCKIESRNGDCIVSFSFIRNRYKNVTVSFCDLAGAIKMKKSITSAISLLDVHGLAKGTYIVFAETPEGLIGKTKLVLSGKNY